MNLQFDWPLALPLLIGIPFMVLWQLRGRQGRPVLRLSNLAGARAVAPTWRVRLRWLPAALRLAVVALLIVAVARPQSGRADTLLPQEGIDIVLVLDTSTSMRQPVVDGDSRLEIAQRVLRSFVAERETDRLGLVAFRSRSIVLSPLTVDYSAFQSLVDSADDLDLPNGTAIGLALADAINLLRDSTAESRTVILLSDGENNRPEVEPDEAARIAQALGIRIYTIGITEAGGESPFSPFQVNETALRTIADLTDGRYFPAAPETLGDVYDAIDSLERSRVGPERFASVNELAPYVLALALLLLAFEVLLTTFAIRRMP
ncbi:MAG: VWA domain-containing protein [Chloroflexi bacterium]|nr:VWA domain-containing protein [Chloroflexota bacterium]